MLKRLQTRLKDVKVVAGSIAALLGLITTVFGTVSYFDSRYALASDTAKLEKRLSLSELKILLRSSQENLYFYRLQVRKYPADLDIKQKLLDASSEVSDIKQQIKGLK